MTIESDAIDLKGSLRRHSLTSVVAMVILVGGVGGWAASTEISGAVIAVGSLVVDSNVKKVQHPTGGVVGELLVRAGDRVNAGDLLLRLDETLVRANLSVTVKSLDQAVAREARLEAEQNSFAEIRFPPYLLARKGDPDAAKNMLGETSLFELRRTVRQGQKAQLQERVAQLRQEIQGYSVQIESKIAQIVSMDRELEGVRELWNKNLVSIQRLTALERERTRSDGDRGQLLTSIAQSKGKISEIELQIIQIDQDHKSEVAKELREVQGKIAELAEKKIAGEDQLRKIDVRAPQTGIVHELAVHTAGEVVGQGEPIMLIVPSTDQLIVEAKVSPQDIDQVRVGQDVVVRLSSLNLRTTPELNGAVVRVSADISKDKKSGIEFYTVRVDLPSSEIARLGSVKLVPGMPAEAYIQTDVRTVLSYLTKPLADQVTRAFRAK